MSQKITNIDIDWDAFDPRLYLQANYTSVLPPDAEILSHLVRFYHEHTPAGRFIEIGAGPNLYPILAALPYAQTVDVLEHGTQNVHYLNRQFFGLDPMWRQWMHLLGTLDPIYKTDLEAQFKEKVTVKHGDLFDLKEKDYDLVSMHFVSESLSEDMDEFFKANKCAVQAIRPGGLFSASFMENSLGYDSPGRKFPAVAITAKEVSESLSPYIDDLDVHRIQTGGGVVRPGHTGMLLVVGKRNSKT